MTNNRVTVLTAAILAISTAGLLPARAADLPVGPDGVTQQGRYRYSARTDRYTEREVRVDNRSHPIIHPYRSHVRAGYGQPAAVVVHRTIERRPVVIERRTVVERPTIIERRTIVERPVVERHVVVEEPAPFPSVVDRGPTVIDLAPAPLPPGPDLLVDDPY
jgi:hypothetical protein